MPSSIGVTARRPVARAVLVVTMSLVAVVAAVSCSDAGSTAKPVASGASWSRVRLGQPPPEDAGMVQSIVRVNIANKGVWLALGSVSAGPGLLQKPGAWASADDRNWSAIGMPVGDDETGSVGAAASNGPKGLVGGAVGTGRASRPAVWTATDPFTWSGPTPLPVPPDTRGAVVHSIAKGPAGWVAVGGAAVGGEAPPLFWYSADGDSWNLGDTTALPRSHAAWSVASSSDRFVSVVSGTNLPAGEPAAGPAVVLSSADGRAWEPARLDGFDQPQVMRSVARVRDWFVAPVDCCGPATQHRLAVSRDGRNWSPGLTLEGVAPISAVTSLADRDGRLVAWGGDGGDLWARETGPTQALDDASLATDEAWSALALPPAPVRAFTVAPPGYGTGRVAASGPTLVVDRPSLTKQLVSWTVGDGTWHTATADLAPPARQATESVTALAGSAQRVVAVGRATYVPLGEQAARPDAGRIWTSTGELLSWEEILVNGNITDLRGVASDGSHFVAVGVKGDRPVVLVSKSGRAWDEVTLASDLDELLGTMSSAAESTGSSATNRSDTTTGGGGDGVGSGGVDDAGNGDGSLLDGERPTGIVRFHDRYVIRTDAGHLWWSPNGAGWKPVALPSGPSGAILPAQSPCAAPDVLLAAPYRTADGDRWTIDPAFPASFTSRACAVDADGSAVFLPGSTTDPTTDPPAYSVLADGRIDARSFDQGPVAGVAWVGRWLLLGRTDRDPRGDPAVWESADARAWKPYDAPTDLVRDAGSGGLTSALVWNDRLVLAGTANDGGLALVGHP